MQKAGRSFRLPREHSNEVSVYRRAANEPNQGSSMQQVVQNASNSCSTRQNNDSARKNDSDFSYLWWRSVRAISVRGVQLIGSLRNEDDNDN